MVFNMLRVVVFTLSFMVHYKCFYFGVNDTSPYSLHLVFQPPSYDITSLTVYMYNIILSLGVW